VTTQLAPSRVVTARRLIAARDRVFTVATSLALALLVTALAGIVFALAARGAPGLGPDLLSPRGDVLRSLYGMALCTMVMTVAVMPVGIAAAIHLAEYARQDSVVVAAVRAAIRTLASVPSIVFGLFGLGFFVLFVGRGLDATLYGDGAAPVFGRPGVLWASLTLAILTLPVVIVTTEEALRSVPRELREAGQALGASKLHTIVHVVLPAARAGVLTGAILAVSRGAGEVAAVLFTGVATYVPRFPVDLRDGFQHLGYHIYVLATQAPEGDAGDAPMFACALLFVVSTCALNAAAFALRDRARRST
jgi:phosphate transport system permease protein